MWFSYSICASVYETIIGGALLLFIQYADSEVYVEYFYRKLAVDDQAGVPKISTRMINNNQSLSVKPRTLPSSKPERLGHQ